MPKNHMPVAHFGVRPENVQAEFLCREALKHCHFEARATTTTADAFVIDILGIIGDSWDDTGVTASKISALLRMAGDRPVVANIDSPGGSFFEGLAIYNLFRLHKGEVTTRVVGCAASAASIIAIAGDRVEIAKNAFFMIHNVRTGVFADAPRMRNVVVQLEAFDAELADLYSARTGIDAPLLTAMMNEGDKFISGREAVAQKFADAFIPADQLHLVACAGNERVQAKADIEFAMVARAAGLSRTEARDLKKRISSKPSAADDDTPRAVESMSALMGSFKSFLGTEET